MAKFYTIFFGFSIMCLCNSEIPIDYSDSVLVKIQPKTDEGLEELKSLDQVFQGVDILKRSFGPNDTTDIVVPKRLQDDVANYIGHRLPMLKVDLVTDFKVNNTVDRPENFRRSFGSGRETFDTLRYHNYDEILLFQEQLQASYPTCVRNKQIGQSSEGRPLILTYFTKNRYARRIFVDAGIHAREWVAPAMAVYLMERLAAECNEEGGLLDQVSWIVLPMVNPDGYEFSRKRGNRMWRKTRSHHFSICTGVDGNRNYGFKWGVSGVSNNPCDPQLYAGPSAFSEPETRAVRDVLLGVKNIKLYVSLHAYGQYLVYPWGYTGKTLPNRWRELDYLATQVSRSIEAAGGQPFKVTSAGKWYPAAGGSDDYAFAVAKIPFTYTMELTDGHEFTFPEGQLRVVLPQFYEGFKTFAKYIGERYPASNR